MVGQTRYQVFTTQELYALFDVCHAHYKESEEVEALLDEIEAEMKYRELVTEPERNNEQPVPA